MSLHNCLDIGQGEPVGSVPLAVRVVGLVGVEEDMPQVRTAAVAHDLQATELRDGAHVAPARLLSRVDRLESWRARGVHIRHGTAIGSDHSLLHIESSHKSASCIAIFICILYYIYIYRMRSS